MLRVRDCDMTARQLAEFINQLPPDMQDAEVCSLVGSIPSTAKRVMAIRTKDGGRMIAVNSMGTHLCDRFAEHCEFVSTVSYGGEIQ